MDECIDYLGYATTFTKFDCNSRYLKIDFDEHARDKTALCSHFGLYRFTRMPFGLRNAVSTFQRSVYVILSNSKCKFALDHFDYVIVFIDRPMSIMNMFEQSWESYTNPEIRSAKENIYRSRSTTSVTSSDPACSESPETPVTQDRRLLHGPHRPNYVRFSDCAIFIVGSYNRSLE